MPSDPSVLSPGSSGGSASTQPPTLRDAGTPPQGPLTVGRPAPQRWTGRASVTPRAGARKRPTLALDVTDPLGLPPVVVVAPGGRWRWAPRRRLRRFLGALLALALILAVPVVSAYVSYKLASGENPFEWPPTVDWDKFFG